jgi:hypothetical protein
MGSRNRRACQAAGLIEGWEMTGSFDSEFRNVSLSETNPAKTLLVLLNCEWHPLIPPYSILSFYTARSNFHMMIKNCPKKRKSGK